MRLKERTLAFFYINSIQLIETTTKGSAEPFPDFLSQPFFISYFIKGWNETLLWWSCIKKLMFPLIHYFHYGSRTSTWGLVGYGRGKSLQGYVPGCCHKEKKRFFFVEKVNFYIKQLKSSKGTCHHIHFSRDPPWWIKYVRIRPGAISWVELISTVP